jgi:hypothetical protein
MGNIKCVMDLDSFDVLILEVPGVPRVLTSLHHPLL